LRVGVRHSSPVYLETTIAAEPNTFLYQCEANKPRPGEKPTTPPLDLLQSPYTKSCPGIDHDSQSTSHYPTTSPIPSQPGQYHKINSTDPTPQDPSPARLTSPHLTSSSNPPGPPHSAPPSHHLPHVPHCSPNSHPAHSGSSSPTPVLVPVPAPVPASPPSSRIAIAVCRTCKTRHQHGTEKAKGGVYYWGKGFVVNVKRWFRGLGR
jgi:hypothetical protein